MLKNQTERTCAPTGITSIYLHFNQLMGTDPNTSYFVFDNTLDLLTKDEKLKMDYFQDALKEHGAEIVYNLLCDAITLNHPYIYLKRKEFPTTIIFDILTGNGFAPMMDECGGFYLFIRDMSNDNRVSGIETAADMFSRAYTTRLSMPNIFHTLISTIYKRMNNREFDNVVFKNQSQFLNLTTIKNIVEQVTHFDVRVEDNSSLSVSFVDRPLHRLCQPLQSVEYTQGVIQRVYKEIEDAVSKRKKYITVEFENDSEGYLMSQYLRSDGFKVSYVTTTKITVDWSFAEFEAGKKSTYAFECLRKVNTYNYQKMVKAAISRFIHHSKDAGDTIKLPEPSHPINVQHFKDLFDCFEKNRCFPLIIMYEDDDPSKKAHMFVRLRDRECEKQKN